MLQSAARQRLSSRSLLASTQLRNFQSSSRAFADGSAFDPQTTRPENQKAGEQQSETGTNPAEETANKARGAQEGGAQGSKAETGKGGAERSGQSSRESPDKAGSTKSGGSGGT